MIIQLKEERARKTRAELQMAELDLRARRVQHLDLTFEQYSRLNLLLVCISLEVDPSLASGGVPLSRRITDGRPR